MSTGSITLELLGALHQLPCEELEAEPSRHTGQPLRRLSINFTARGDDSADITAAFGKARESEAALADGEGGRWIVTNNSYSYRDGDSVHRHHAELRELEEVTAERLDMLGLSLVPMRYEERFDSDDALIITARVDPDEPTGNELERQITENPEGYFDVTRVGVGDTPVRMRFGRCLWQKTDTGRAHLLTLVSEEGDSEERSQGLRWFEPQMSRLRVRLAVAEETIELLLGKLQQAGKLSEADVTDIRSRAEAAPKTRLREFDEAWDLDQHF